MSILFACIINMLDNFARSMSIDWNRINQTKVASQSCPLETKHQHYTSPIGIALG